jgi:hypothetical protein
VEAAPVELDRLPLVVLERFMFPCIPASAWAVSELMPWFMPLSELMPLSDLMP